MTAPATAHDALLVARDLGRRVGERWIWRGLTFALAPGERVAITGPTGAGKTLVLRALAGLDPIDEGTLTFEDVAVDDVPMPRYRAQVRLLPQRPVMVEGTVEDNLRLPFGLAIHQAQAFPRAEATALLARLDRPARFLEQPADRLSGGEAQVVALVRTLLVSPRVLLLDEPTTSLDASTTRAIEALVAWWLEVDPARAVVWTSHDAAQLARVVDRRIELATP
ncbi:MAG: ATP-binding cassette domain-containing protein [Trueperaceae bacterium]